MAHLKYLKFLDYRLVDNASVNAAKEQYQDELLELEVISIHIHIVVYVHVIRCISNNQHEPVFSIFHFAYNKKNKMFFRKKSVSRRREKRRGRSLRRRGRASLRPIFRVSTLFSATCSTKIPSSRGT
jgi:hypothetical protein